MMDKNSLFFDEGGLFPDTPQAKFVAHRGDFKNRSGRIVERISKGLGYDHATRLVNGNFHTTMEFKMVYRSSKIVKMKQILKIPIFRLPGSQVAGWTLRQQVTDIASIVGSCLEISGRALSIR